MELNEAIRLLEHHNKWRKGADIPMIQPKVLSEVIDTIIDKYKESNDLKYENG